MQQQGSTFLHERNPNLHASEEVESVVGFLRAGGDAIPNEPADKISAYIGFLANREYVNDGILTGEQSSIDRQIEVHVIKAEDVSESYFELQRRIAREQGHGDVQITPEMRKQMIEAVQSDQRASLGKWVEYLGGDNGGYPDWFKNFTWTSVTKLGSYDKDKSEFQKRSRSTTNLFPDLNLEALSYVYDVLNKSRLHDEKVNGGNNDAKLQNLLKIGNFGKLYAHAVLEVTQDSPELRNEVKGSWTKFNQTDDPRIARRLSTSLQGHGTGWCTAGESTASIHLSGGDFYVYYTRDQDKKDTIPRIAIRMEKGVVAEVRGVNATQELEPVMAETTVEKLRNLPGGEEYIRKAEDMKNLTLIEKKVIANTELTREEIRFLYELDNDIQGFGYERDPRITEIRQMRGERDKPELNRILPEAIRDQLKSSFIAYKTVAEQLSGKRRLFRNGEVAISPEELEYHFSLKDKEWRENGIYEYLVEQLLENESRYTMVVTPNMEASENQIVALAEKFSKDQPFTTYVYDKLYRRGFYSSSELTGDTDNAPVRISLIPSSLDSQISDKNAEEKLRLLKERQTQLPELHARVPSLLDAVTYWYSLRARGDKLNYRSVYNKTYISHFDLEPSLS